jgi:hypothetical protein
MSQFFSIKRLFLLSVAAAIVAAAAGCGGGSDESTSVAGKGGTTEAGGGSTSTRPEDGSKRKEGEKPGAAIKPPEGSGAQQAPKLPEGPGAQQAPKSQEPTEPRQAPKPQETPEAPSSPAKAAFVKRANTICTKGYVKGLKKVNAYVKAHTKSGQPKPEQFIKAYQAALLPAVQSQIDEIRALGAPPGDEQQVEAFLAAMEEAVDTAGQGRVSSLPRFEASFERSAKLARGYGLSACAYS